jgi:dTMP kinase
MEETETAKKMADLASRGSLIPFEGCGHSGKTTQVTKLVKTLNSEGKLTKMIKFPVRSTNIGKVIKKYLSSSQAVEVPFLGSSSRI